MIIDAPHKPFAPSRADWKEASLVALGLFALYALSAPRTVGLEDDALFILSSYFLGIEHPPGFPLFTLIAHPFTYLPLSSVAYRVHLASAFFGALTCAGVWLCARALTRARLPSYVAALALGASAVFWSQSIIADVYTLNTFLFVVLVYFGLRACPPIGAPAAPEWLLPLMAFLYGLSLSNHWPLMLLVAPAFAVLLWPLRRELLRRAPLLLWCLMLGLLPYVWLIYRSWQPLPVSFYGPLYSLHDIWFFVSRAGYVEVDHSPSADWLDRVKFLRFFGGQLFVQFAVLGTLLAAAGFAVQRRVLGTRVAGFLAAAFAMPSIVLVLLLGFDYSMIMKHVFHVYPLPSYVIVALWTALGAAWLIQRFAVPAPAARAAGAAVVALIFTFGARSNLHADHEWGARYAQAMLSTLPDKAVVFARGEADLGTLAYFHLIEGRRPDITLYQTKGLILGNRLFDPVRTPEDERQRILREAVARHTDPVVSTLERFTGYGRRDRWLFTEVDKAADPSEHRIDIPEQAMGFFEHSVLEGKHPNAFTAYLQGQLRRRYAELLGLSLPRSGALDARRARHLELLANDYYGALGLAEGMLHNKDGYSVGALAALLERAGEHMPSDALKDELAHYFYIRGLVRADLRDEKGALQDFETALSVWPVSTNWAIKPMEDLYTKTGDTSALDALKERVKRLGKPRV